MVDHLGLLITETPQERFNLVAADDMDRLNELFLHIAFFVSFDDGRLHVVVVLLLGGVVHTFGVLLRVDEIIWGGILGLNGHCSYKIIQAPFLTQNRI